MRARTHTHTHTHTHTRARANKIIILANIYLQNFINDIFELHLIFSLIIIKRNIK